MLAFIHVRKTAGSTIDMILRQTFGVGHCRMRHGKARAAQPIITAQELQRSRWIYWTMQAVSGHGIVPHSDLDSLDTEISYFTFVRDPLVRTASDFQFRVVRGSLRESFDEWITSSVARNQITVKLAGKEDADAAIEMIENRIGFVGVVERFDESLVMMKRWYRGKELDIRYAAKNVSRDSTIKQELLAEPRKRAKLIDANREDIKLYQYILQQTYPRQSESYGASLESDVQTFRASNKPRPVWPRQLPSMLLREALYKPASGLLREKTNPLRR